MLKMFFFLKADQRFSREEFTLRWIDARTAHVAQGGYRNVLRYAFNSILEKDTELSPTGHKLDDQWHGVDELWFDDEQTFTKACHDKMLNPLVDGNPLLDNGACRLALAREIPNAGSPEPGGKYKSFLQIRRLPNLSQPEFYYHWTVIHPPIWAKVRTMVHFSPPPKIGEKLSGGQIERRRCSPWFRLHRRGLALRFRGDGKSISNCGARRTRLERCRPVQGNNDRSPRHRACAPREILIADMARRSIKRSGQHRHDPRIKVEVGISAAFGCTIQGEVPEDAVVALAAQCAEAGADDIGLSDTYHSIEAGPGRARFKAGGPLFEWHARWRS